MANGHIHRTYLNDYVCITDPDCDIAEQSRVDQLIELEFREGVARIGDRKRAEAQPIT